MEAAAPCRFAQHRVFAADHLDVVDGPVTGGTVALNGNTPVNGSTAIQAAVADNGTITVNSGTLGR